VIRCVRPNCQDGHPEATHYAQLPFLEHPAPVCRACATMAVAMRAGEVELIEPGDGVRCATCYTNTRVVGTEACEKAGHTLIPTRGDDATLLHAVRKPYVDGDSVWNKVHVPFQPIRDESGDS
jgi:hypothetical protein